MTEHLNADFTQAVVVHTSAMEWQQSPSPRVWRKRLDLSGPKERGRVTSVVRYDANSKFHPHLHPDGEEILVLDGVFSDGHGDFPAGSYLLNPEGFEHAPFSKSGCVLFVKLKQYPGPARRQIAINMLEQPWEDQGNGVSRLTLYKEEGYPERMAMVRVEDGATLTFDGGLNGSEMFLLSGAFLDDNGSYATGDWLRWPTVEDRVFTATDTVTAYIKTGHLSVWPYR